jgi:DNA-binding PadR family transcriptional regulator
MSTTVIKPSNAAVRKADIYLANVLVNCGSWHLLHEDALLRAQKVVSDETLQHREILASLLDEGVLAMRVHYADKFPNGVQAYELTELGLATLEEVVETVTKDKDRAQEAADAAVEQREFYRRETSLAAWQARVAADRLKKAQEAQIKEALRVIEVET